MCDDCRFYSTYFTFVLVFITKKKQKKQKKQKDGGINGLNQLNALDGSDNVDEAKGNNSLNKKENGKDKETEQKLKSLGKTKCMCKHK